MKINRILLPTDFSEYADRAMRQAVELAVHCRARIDVFHGVTLHAEDPAHLKVSLEDYLKKVEEEISSDLSERSETIRRRGVKVKGALARAVSPFEAIMDKQSETNAELIVMGTHGRTGVEKLLMGSVAEKVVRHAPCHVVTVGKDAVVAEGESGFERILVPVDFASHSEKAVSVARELLSPHGQLVLSHVVSVPIHPSFYAGGITRMFELDPDLPGRIRDKLASLYDGPAEMVVTEGDVVAEILATVASQKAQMIVMGTQGLSGLDHVLVGSVTERVIRKASVPVLSVK